jgi:hypothetical protein
MTTLNSLINFLMMEERCREAIIYRTKLVFPCSLAYATKRGIAFFLKIAKIFNDGLITIEKKKLTILLPHHCNQL